MIEKTAYDQKKIDKANAYLFTLMYKYINKKKIVYVSRSPKKIPGKRQCTICKKYVNKSEVTQVTAGKLYCEKCLSHYHPRRKY